MFDHIKNSPDYRWYVLATVSIGTFMGPLDGSIVNVALPTISGQLHTDLTTLQWIVTAYLLTISSLLPVFGRVADLLGRKRIYSLGFLVFILGSALIGALAAGLFGAVKQIRLSRNLKNMGTQLGTQRVEIEYLQKKLKKCEEPPGAQPGDTTESGG